MFIFLALLFQVDIDSSRFLLVTAKSYGRKRFKFVCVPSLSLWNFILFPCIFWLQKFCLLHLILVHPFKRQPLEMVKRTQTIRRLFWDSPFCGFDHIYWRNPQWKTSFFVQCYWKKNDRFNNFVFIFLLSSRKVWTIERCWPMESVKMVWVNECLR